MNFFTQSLINTRLALETIPQRAGSSLVVVMSMTCVVGVLLSMLSETAGLGRAYQAGGDPGRAIVISNDSISEYGSLSRSDVATIADAPGIAKGTDGKPLLDAEVLFWTPPTKGYTVISPQLRGVGPAGFAVRPEVKLLQGRLFHPGLQELIVGVTAAKAFKLGIGDKVILPDGNWPIVGIFSAGGGIIEGQLVGDAETVMTSSHISTFGSVIAELERPDSFDTFRSWLTHNPALGVTAERQSEFYLRTANQFAAFFTKVAYVVGATMALGALFGSVKIMYATVDARTREIGTLRALGYDSLPVAVSVIAETILLALLGAILGASLAWTFFNGKLIADHQHAFNARVTPELVELGLGWAVGVAILAALAPAVRAARLPIPQALRAP